mmetsp:Transcript_78068/g.219009  ORF Transcript_78068/g.219009 Transcript_78068/m.219009 type:complete len:203 (-) Transcript_78068:163-771(-)
MPWLQGQHPRTTLEARQRQPSRPNRQSGNNCCEEREHSTEAEDCQALCTEAQKRQHDKEHDVENSVERLTPRQVDTQRRADLACERLQLRFERLQRRECDPCMHCSNACGSQHKQHPRDTARCWAEDAGCKLDQAICPGPRRHRGQLRRQHGHGAPGQGHAGAEKVGQGPAGEQRHGEDRGRSEHQPELLEGPWQHEATYPN